MAGSKQGKLPQVLKTYRVRPSVQEHDKIFRPGISVLDFALITMVISGEFGNVKSLIGLFDTGLRGYRHFDLRGHGGCV